MRDYIVCAGIRIAKDFVPEKIGSLTTLGPIFRCRVGNQRKYYQVCQCDCGQVLVMFVSNLTRRPNTTCRSCSTRRRRRLENEHRPKLAATREEHVVQEKKLRSTYYSMIFRCSQPRYKLYHRYGGRGIKVCEQWLEPKEGFWRFVQDVGVPPSKNHTLDRIDNDGDYCPENCRWATKKEQANNRVTNRVLEYKGEKKTLAEWCNLLSLRYDVIQQRIQSHGWSVEEAFEAGTDDRVFRRTLGRADHKTQNPPQGETK